MHRTHFRLCLLVMLALSLFQPRAQAQVLWHQTFACQTWRSEYNITRLSSYGSTCIASGTLHDGVDESEQYVFLRSSDGGVTWIQQDPGFPKAPFGDLLLPFYNLQQIDDQTAVASRIDGLFVRTTDGGKSWNQQISPSAQPLSDLHFSSSDSGIATIFGSGLTGVIFTTNDGGVSWQTPTLPFDASGLVSCHSYGNGKYAVFSQQNAQLLRTNDNWNTAQISSPIIDSSIDSNWQAYTFTKCLFGDGDTVIVLGTLPFQLPGGGAVVVRSDDGGRNWQTPQRFQDPYSLQYASQINRDTIILASFDTRSPYKILMSTDRGYSWTRDTMMLASGITAVNLIATTQTNIGLVAIVIELDQSTNGTLTYLERAVPLGAGVATQMMQEEQQPLFPNPASNYVRVECGKGVQSVQLYDMLSREVARSACDADGNAQFDVRQYAQGAYFVISQMNGSRRMIGRLIIDR